MKKILLIVVLLSNCLGLSETKAQVSTVRPIIFPVIGAVTYYDDFGAPRDGHTHEGNDLMGKKLLPLVAAVDGTIVDVEYPEPSWGYNVVIKDAEGYTYHYLHINNDTPGTDDGLGGGMNAYAPDIKQGNHVVAGQLIGWMGDSGNAETVQAHLHFEIRLNGTAFSPYLSLKAAKKISVPVDYPALSSEILPYGGFQGGASIAVGNLDADSEPEIVTGARNGGGPHVEVFDRNSQSAKVGFFAYAPTFTGGVDVATGDINGDGVDEIITAPGKGGGPNVKVFTAAGNQLLSFMAYTPGFTGGVNVAAADLNDDGKDEIITAPAFGGGPHVKIFDAAANVVGQFMAYPGFTGGIDVAADQGIIVTAPNTGGGPHVKIFDLNGNVKSEFMAYDPAHRGGMRVSVSNNQIATAPLLGGPDFRKFDLKNKLASDSAFEEWWMGSYDIASDQGITFVATGPNTKRRTSVRMIDWLKTTRTN